MSQGAIVTFDDVTELERSEQELQLALTALEKSRDDVRFQNEELQVLASSDPLTGLTNRRAFLLKLETDVANAIEDSADLSCVMIDIDHFKRVNDDHGHLTGDKVIIAVARALEERGDCERVCRYGGEEFCITFWGTTSEEAVEHAEEIRLRIAAEGFAEVPVTASFGISSLREGVRTPQALINLADEALYRAKKSGRNRVCR